MSNHLVNLILQYLWPLLVLVIFTFVALLYAYIWLPMLTVINETLFGFFAALSSNNKSLLCAFLIFGETILTIWLGFILAKFFCTCCACPDSLVRQDKPVGKEENDVKSDH